MVLGTISCKTRCFPPTAFPPAHDLPQMFPLWNNGLVLMNVLAWRARRYADLSCDGLAEDREVAAKGLITTLSELQKEEEEACADLQVPIRPVV